MNLWRTNQRPRSFLGCWAIALLAVVVVLVLIAMCAGCDKQATHSNEPWVIYEDGFETRTNRDAVSHWIMTHASCGCGYSGDDSVLTIYLGDEPPATPRAELLEVANQVRNHLPKGCPIIIEVQTLDEAIADSRRRIKELEDGIKWMEKTHTDRSDTKVRFVELGVDVVEDYRWEPAE